MADRGVGSGQPRALFVLPRLLLQTGGLTKAWLERIRLFESHGWAVHVALLAPDPRAERTVATVRAEGRLPQGVVVHHFAREARNLRRLALIGLRPRHRDDQLAAWLDQVAGRDGALVFGDTPVTYSILARMRNPRVGIVYAIHLAHLSAEATRLPTREAIANGPLTKRFSELSQATIRAADRIVVLTEAQKADLQLRWGADLPVAVIPHCAHPVDVAPDTPYDPRLVVILGRLDRTKRWDTALRTMARVLRRVPDARLVVYGRGDDLERLQGIAEDLGITGSVTFAGYTSDPARALAEAACVLSTTRREGLPLTLLETLAVGTPVVVHDIRYGPAEVVRDGVDGFVVAVGDVKAASAAVVRLLTDPELRGRMSRSAREVTDRFSCQAHDSAWLALGREVHEQRGRRASSR